MPHAIPTIPGYDAGAVTPPWRRPPVCSSGRPRVGALSVGPVPPPRVHSVPPQYIPAFLPPRPTPTPPPPSSQKDPPCAEREQRGQDPQLGDCDVLLHAIRRRSGAARRGPVAAALFCARAASKLKPRTKAPSASRRNSRGPPVRHHLPHLPTGLGRLLRRSRPFARARNASLSRSAPAFPAPSFVKSTAVLFQHVPARTRLRA